LNNPGAQATGKFFKASPQICTQTTLAWSVYKTMFP
jgi:hypothetical protein